MNAENRPESELLGETVRHLMNVDDEEYIFKLVGVIIHEGTAEHGHYFSLINTKRGNDETDESKPEWL
jgi:ubiquitin C-terminal hydrolase